MGHGMRLGVGLFSAATLGLSCTACLSSSSFYTGKWSSLPPPGYSYTTEAEPDIVRLSRTPSPQNEFRQSDRDGRLPVQFQSQSQGAPIVRGASRSPVGQANGIDIATAGFARSVSDRSISTNYPRLTPIGNQTYQAETVDANYEILADSRSTGLGVDVSVRPHVSIDRSENFRSTRAGAEVRIGQDLDRRGKATKNSKVYLFAGADGEALVWDVRRIGSAGLTNGLVTLQDRVTVGDVQAGVAWESPAGQMSISYIEREYEYRNGAISRSGEEDFVALTLTWRR